MKKYFSLLFIIFSTSFLLAQPTKRPVPKKAISELEKLLTGTGLPYTMMNDSVSVIPYEGESIASYKVVIQKLSDLYIVYTNLTEVLPNKLNESIYKYLLIQNDHYDLIKIGIGATDEEMYLRADLYKAAATSALLKKLITQVANVTNIIAGEIIQKK